MTSHAVANELGTDIFEVDVPRLVSIYIGETKKNLDTILTEAERANAVIALHDFDSLACRRGLQKDTQDRSANMEVAYMLQRIEGFTALAILTTNFKQTPDPAFLCRLRFSIDSPPSRTQKRVNIWRQCIPQAAPLLLARLVEITGRNIQQVTLRVAFAAAAERSSISMRHLIAATRAELVKFGEHTAVRDLNELASLHTSVLAA